jgi:hypothetical protein
MISHSLRRSISRLQHWIGMLDYITPSTLMGSVGIVFPTSIEKIVVK